MKQAKEARRTQGRIAASAVTPFLWFDHEAEAAAKFYVSLFAGSRITDVARNLEPGGGRPTASVVSFELGGQPFVALNGGPIYKLSPAFSIQVTCRSQRDVDTLWRRLSRGGEPGQCGWLVDRFGLSWQLIPERLGELLRDTRDGRGQRAMEAMMKMGKIDLRVLERAADGSSAE